MAPLARSLLSLLFESGAGAGGKEMLDLPPMIPGAPELTRLERVGQLGKGAFGKVIEVRPRGETCRQATFADSSQ